MCPICIGSALYVLGGAGSAGGIAALTMRTFKRRKASRPVRIEKKTPLDDREDHTHQWIASPTSSKRQ